MKLRYFAWVRSRLGCAEETMMLDCAVPASAILERLRERGEPYASVLAATARLRLAINRRHVGPDALVGDGDELAIFPPVTGG